MRHRSWKTESALASDLKLDLQDIVLESADGDLDLVADDYEIPQSCQIRFLTIAAEQFDNTAVGLPWMHLMSDSGTADNVKRALLVREILQTPGVKKLDDFRMEKSGSHEQVQFSISTPNNKFDLGITRAK